MRKVQGIFSSTLRERLWGKDRDECFDFFLGRGAERKRKPGEAAPSSGHFFLRAFQGN